MKNRSGIRALAWLLVVGLPVWLGSCTKDGDDAVTPNSVEGTWQISGLKINPAVDLLGTGQKSNDLLALLGTVLGDEGVTCLTGTRITFNAGGKITGQPGPKCTATTEEYVPVDNASTWQLNGSKLTITSGTEVTTYDVTISGNSLRMDTQETDDLDGDGTSETYTYTTELTRV